MPINDHLHLHWAFVNVRNYNYIADIQVGLREYSGYIVRQATQFHECPSGIDTVEHSCLSL